MNAQNSKQEVQQARLEGVAILANTVAHELLQPLTVIKAELDFSKMLNQPLDPETLERINGAIAAIVARIDNYQHVTRFETFTPLAELTNYQLLVV